MAVAKPVLYFHRAGAGALVVDVEARVAGGRIVEHWPSMGAEPGDVARWHHVLVQPGSCHGSRYPGGGDDPCLHLSDACEAATLATVETTDADCLTWPEPPGGDGPTEAWNHLFYRGEVTGAPALPLRVEPLADGTLRVTSTTTDPIPGRLVRVRRANGVAGATDAAEVAAPPAPGASVVVAAPHASLASGAEALAASLRDAGLTEQETSAFRRSWDEPLFGVATVADLPVVAATPPFAAPQAAPVVTTSLLYVLPVRTADALAPLHFDPAPTAVRRAIVVWFDEAPRR